ncbi:hypothetical protein [Bathymodiolus platifrons methanotrophic gill symbiont]|uniref:hypothetical protein n=1 Tax=Bathymodiolus platifrons methanotrophic gill symbiont TaxID=113268 RepID=UPI001C8D03D6|nr:hypothetical protein [Bathymodiolus platifrons methanotrophic gill symbiont]
MATSNGSTAIRDKILASLARYRALRIGKFPCAFWKLSSRPGLTAKELQEVDDAVHKQQLSIAQFVQLNRELQQIENEVNKVKTPLSYADQVYNLMLHIDLVRKKLALSKSASISTKSRGG